MSAVASATPEYVNQGAKRRRLRDRLTAEDAGHQQHEADDATFRRPFPGRQNRRYKPMNTAIGMVAAMVNVPHGLPLSALTTTKRDDGQQDDHDQQHGDQRSEAADLADLLAGDLAERFSVAPDGAEEDHEILHGSARASRRSRSTESREGSRTARPGSAPPVGPGPAIAAKWWPKTIHLLVGSKS